MEEQNQTIREDLQTQALLTIDGTIEFRNPALARMQVEADRIQEFISVPACLTDPAALTVRLNDADVWMARLTGMLVTARSMRDYARAVFLRDNERLLSKMTATASNRIIATSLFEFTATADRLEQLYQTLTYVSRDLVTQISFIKKQMEMR